MLGFDASSKTAENLHRNGQCVLNLPAELAPSSLAQVPEALYRSPGVDRARHVA